MIQYKQGNIIAEDAEALVNTVNCVGVMGRGIALQFKKSFPANFKAYALACKREEVCPGRMFVYETGQFVNPRYIINFPTKRHWRAKSRLEDIDAGLESLVEEIRKRNVRSVAIPPLGCGLGGLDWARVRPRIEAALRSLEQVRTVVFEPGNSRVDSRSSRCTAAPEQGVPGDACIDFAAPRGRQRGAVLSGGGRKRGYVFRLGRRWECSVFRH